MGVKLVVLAISFIIVKGEFVVNIVNILVANRNIINRFSFLEIRSGRSRKGCIHCICGYIR